MPQPPKVGLIDYGMGNLLSVRHALEMVGADVAVCRKPADVAALPRLVLPGVGAFPDCMKQLTETGMADALQQAVIQEGKPILGICLGMQAMAQRSVEGVETAGLGWFDADVVRLEPSDARLRVPHVGWNDIAYRSDSPLFAGLAPTPDVYFVHSYQVRARIPDQVDAICEYGGAVTAAIRRDNIAATQFHPEKSQEHGLRLLANFLRWTP